MEKNSIVLASNNPHKVAEMREILSSCGVDVIVRDDLPDVIEDRDSFEGNAEKKAREIAEYTGLICVADDSGLEVDALNGAPGVFSARYAGADKDYAANNQKLLRELTMVSPEKRTARFRTVVALCNPDGTCCFAEGCCEGVILEELRGSNGFGYDPLFHVSGSTKTMAEMTSEEKHAVSHRGKALRALAEIIKNNTKNIFQK